MGLSPDEFWRLTWAEYNLMCEGYAEREQRKFQGEWERTRWVTFHLMNVQIDRKHRLRSLQRLIKFPWEKSELRNPHMTKDEFLKLQKKWGLN